MNHKNPYHLIIVLLICALIFTGIVAPVLTTAVFNNTSVQEAPNTVVVPDAFNGYTLIDGGNGSGGGAGTCGSNC